MDRCREYAVEAPPRLLHPHAHKSAGSTAQERARRTRDPTTKGQRVPLHPNTESEEVLGRRTLLRDAPRLLRRRLEDAIRPRQLRIKFENSSHIPAAIAVVRRAPDRDERLVEQGLVPFHDELVGLRGATRDATPLSRLVSRRGGDGWSLVEIWADSNRIRTPARTLAMSFSALTSLNFSTTSPPNK